MATRQQKLASLQLAKKIKLENKFKPKLTRFFRQLGKDINVVWATTGNIPNLKPFEPELVFLLREHYRDVAKLFSGEVRAEIKHFNLQLETKQISETVDSDIMQYIMSHSIENAGIILATTQKELQTIVAGVLVNSALQDIPLTNLQIGNQIKENFINKTGKRVETIAITETNTTAERIKYIEANAFQSVINESPSPAKLVDTWNTTLDERTRASHVAADRQEVTHGRPFTVQGQLLRFPGDTALGASLDNVINCRCSAITSISGVDAPIATIPAIPIIRLN